MTSEEKGGSLFVWTASVKRAFIELPCLRREIVVMRTNENPFPVVNRRSTLTTIYAGHVFCISSTANNL